MKLEEVRTFLAKQGEFAEIIEYSDWGTTRHFRVEILNSNIKLEVDIAKEDTYIEVKDTVANKVIKNIPINTDMIDFPSLGAFMASFEEYENINKTEKLKDYLEACFNELMA